VLPGLVSRPAATANPSPFMIALMIMVGTAADGSHTQCPAARGRLFARAPKRGYLPWLATAAAAVAAASGSRYCEETFLRSSSSS
jgi:hypothetical protein